MLDQRLSTIPQHQWIKKLFDALSCKDGEHLNDLVLLVPSFLFYDDLKQEISNSLTLYTMKEDINFGHHGEPWHVNDRLILHSNLVCVLSSSLLLDTALQVPHTARHEGTQKKLYNARVQHFTLNMIAI